MGNFIRYYDGILSAEFCNEVIRRFEADDSSEPGRVHRSDGRAALDLQVKQTTELVISARQGWEDVEQELQGKYIECVNRYAEEFPQIGEIGGQLSSEAFRIKKYAIGGFFNWHLDCTGDGFYRVLAIQFYFNRVDEGGETEFRFQDCKVQAVPGRVVIFPTLWTYHHRGATVISNPKYICTNFVRLVPALPAD